MKVTTILDQIDLGSIALPEFQRGYVWNRDQVRALMHSLYRDYPVGGLLVWRTKTEATATKGQLPPSTGHVDLLLDGQQRMTTLYGVIRGKRPQFFDGNVQTFTGLYFNLETETFEFYTKQKMATDSTWVDVTGLMTKGIVPYLMPFMNDPDRQAVFMERLNRLSNIKSIEFHVATVTGDDKNVDVVVDIFNRLNSGGTKLSKGDLALARICAAWPEARREMKVRLAKWEKAGYFFKLDWFLRCITAILTGKAAFESLEKTTVSEFADGIKRAEKAIDYLLNLLAGRLGIDHDRVLGAPYTIPLLARYVDKRGGLIVDPRERDRLLYWYVHAFLWGRYSGSTESVLTQDLTSIDSMDGALDRLIANLRAQRGDLTLQPADFAGWSTSNRFYPLLHMMSRVGESIDWRTGLLLKNTLLGGSNKLHVHHVFPKARLQEAGVSRPLRNTLANYTFLTAGTNMNVGAQDPFTYLKEVEANYPGALESHWIPMDQSLWKLEVFEQFVAARRVLLAAAANKFLDSLISGHPQALKQVSLTEWAEATLVPECDEPELDELNAWLLKLGLPRGETDFEIVKAEATDAAVLDLAWPAGLQQGLSGPVALVLERDDDTVSIASAEGYRIFTSVYLFKKYVESEVLAGVPREGFRRPGFLPGQ